MHSVMKTTQLDQPVVTVLRYIETVQPNIPVAHSSAVDELHSTQHLNHTQ